MTKYFKDRFAVYGDMVEIPDNIQSSGSVSYQQGFTVDYQRKLGTDPLAKTFPRQGFNGLMSDITGAIQQYQQCGFFDFITPEMNGGDPFSYEMGATVRYDMSASQDGSDVHNFTSLIKDNNTNPKSNPENWQDIGKTDIEFATDEEILNEVEGKAIDPRGLSSVKSTTIRRGLIQIASEDDVDSGINSTKAVPPSLLNRAVSNSFSNNKIAGNGYQILPSGLIIQWGTAKGANGVGVLFPVAFPNNAFSVTGSDNGGNNIFGCTSVSKTGFKIYTNISSQLSFSYWAIGN